MNELEKREKVHDPWKNIAIILGGVIILLSAAILLLFIIGGRQKETPAAMEMERTELKTIQPGEEEMEVVSKFTVTTNPVMFKPEEEIATDENGSTETHRYEIVTDAMTWSEAFAVCREKGGYLATVTSQEEWEKIRSIAENSGKKVIWLGAKRSADNTFDWITDEEFSYTNWMEGEPNNEGQNEDYLVMFSVGGKWVWADVPDDLSSYYSDDKIGYIIEYNE